MCVCLFFFFKQKTAYEMRISDWSSDVCSSDLALADTGEKALRLCYGDGSAIAYHHSTEMVAHEGKTYNLVRMEEMLRGIVPRESPASWGNTENGMASLRAQAVAARSHAAAGHTRWGPPPPASALDPPTRQAHASQAHAGLPPHH